MVKKKEITVDHDFNFKILQDARHNPLTTSQRDSLALVLGTAQKGLMVFDTDLNCPYYWTGTLFTTNFEAPLLPFTKLLGDVLTVEVLPAEHGITEVSSILVLNPTGDKVIVQENLASNIVNIYSNISLLNHTLIIN
jgi:hypothetical protein